MLFPSTKILNGTESQRTPVQVSCHRVIRYSGFFRGPFRNGPTVGDFLEVLHGCFNWVMNQIST